MTKEKLKLKKLTTDENPLHGGSTVLMKNEMVMPCAFKTPLVIVEQHKIKGMVQSVFPQLCGDHCPLFEMHQRSNDGKIVVRLRCTSQFVEHEIESELIEK